MALVLQVQESCLAILTDADMARLAVSRMLRAAPAPAPAPASGTVPSAARMHDEGAAVAALLQPGPWRYVERLGQALREAGYAAGYDLPAEGPALRQVMDGTFSPSTSPSAAGWGEGEGGGEGEEGSPTLDALWYLLAVLLRGMAKEAQRDDCAAGTAGAGPVGDAGRAAAPGTWVRNAKVGALCLKVASH